MGRFAPKCLCKRLSQNPTLQSLVRVLAPGLPHSKAFWNLLWRAWETQLSPCTGYSENISYSVASREQKLIISFLFYWAVIYGKAVRRNSLAYFVHRVLRENEIFGHVPWGSVQFALCVYVHLSICQSPEHPYRKPKVWTFALIYLNHIKCAS